MTARLLYLTDLGGRFKRVGFVESRTRFPNTNTFSKALNFIVHKGNLYSYYLMIICYYDLEERANLIILFSIP